MCGSLMSLLAVSLAAAGPVEDQTTPLDPRTPLHLLADGGLQAELKLAPAQRDALAAVRQKLDRGELTAATADRELAKVLTPPQTKRLAEIGRQARGGIAVLDPDVATELRLTADQVRALAAARDTAERQVRDHLARARFASEEARRAYVVVALDRAGRQMLDLLTAPQRAAFANLQGPRVELPAWARVATPPK